MRENGIVRALRGWATEHILALNRHDRSLRIFRHDIAIHQPLAPYYHSLRAHLVRTRHHNYSLSSLLEGQQSPRNHLCSNRRGATHRMNYDTPSLRGSCWESLRILGSSRAASTSCGDQGFLGKPEYSHRFRAKTGYADVESKEHFPHPHSLYGDSDMQEPNTK